MGKLIDARGSEWTLEVAALSGSAIVIAPASFIRDSRFSRGRMDSIVSGRAESGEVTYNYEWSDIHLKCTMMVSGP